MNIKKELRDALYRLLTGEDIQYFKHTWSGWEKKQVKQKVMSGQK